MNNARRHKAQMRSEPWLVPGAIAFLRTFIAERPGCDVLEFGGGASTIWFLRRGCRVVSFESKLSWRERILDAVANRDIVTEEQAACLDLREWEDDTPAQLPTLFDPDSFDLVLVDGLERKLCNLASIPLVRPGGVLMLDNSGTRYVPRPDRLDWDWSCCVQRSPDTFNAKRHARKLATDSEWRSGYYPGWATCWWQRPAPVAKAIYYDVYSEHQR